MHSSRFVLEIMIARRLQMDSTFLLEKWRSLPSNWRSGTAYEIAPSPLLKLCERFTDPLDVVFVGT